MPSKLQTYMQMADEAQRQITGSYRGWTGFLTTAARLYKYPYSLMKGRMYQYEGYSRLQISRRARP